jgi:hypothetical protein
MERRVSLPEVYFDDERVVFEGTAPSRFDELIGLLHGAAEAAGRIVAEVQVDGVAVADGDDVGALETMKRIDLRTITVREALRRMCGGFARRLAETAKELEILDREVLRNAWSSRRARCIAWAEACGALVQETGAASSREEVDPWREGLETKGAAVVGAMERWVEAVALGDSARVCVCGERELVPALRRFESVFAEIEGALG